MYFLGFLRKLFPFITSTGHRHYVAAVMAEAGLLPPRWEKGGLLGGTILSEVCKSESSRVSLRARTEGAKGRLTAYILPEPDLFSFHATQSTTRSIARLYPEDEIQGARKTP